MRKQNTKGKPIHCVPYDWVHEVPAEETRPPPQYQTEDSTRLIK